jgi:crossover junction endodeoxyribonuclease RuvC
MIIRVLAIDPSLRGTGYAVLERRSGTPKAQALEYGVVKNSATLRHTECLAAIHRKTMELIERHRPDCAAFEGIIYVQSHKTAIAMGSARGAALTAAGLAGLPVYEYAPRRVKQAVVGAGGAQKHQVAFMIRALLGLTETPPADAADAIAIGLAHIQAAEFARCGAVVLEQI